MKPRPQSAIKSQASKILGAIQLEDFCTSKLNLRPEFPGGIEKMMQFIAHNLRYPETCTCVQGRVIIRFYVDTLGHVCDPTVFKGLDPVFDAEALRVVKLMPDFKPGKIKDKNVNVWFTVPITFKLAVD